MGKLKDRFCLFCNCRKPADQFNPHRQLRKCIEHEHLYRCFKCGFIGEEDKFRPETNPGKCRKCINRIKTIKVQTKKSPMFVAKMKRLNDKRNEVLRNNTIINKKQRIILTKEESITIKKLRGSIHKTFKRWYSEKSLRSMDYLDYGHKEFLNKFPEIDEGIQIDHKIPISWFEIDSPINIIYDLDNLQLLSQKENREKYNFYCSPIPQILYNKVLPYIKKHLIERLVIEDSQNF